MAARPARSQTSAHRRPGPARRRPADAPARRERRARRLGLQALLTLALTLGTAAGPAAALQGGTARVDITPSPTTAVPMSGYEGSGTDDPSLGLHDSLAARILVLDDGATSVALVALDLIGFNPGRLPDRLDAAGLDGWLFMASHTHAGPRVLDLTSPYVQRRGWSADPGYADRLDAAILEGVEQARSHLQPVTVTVGAGAADLAFNRRVVHADGSVEMVWAQNGGERIPYGPVDPEVGVIRVDDQDGEPLAILVNYACHAVVLGDANRYLSADYPGAMSRYLEAAFPGAVALFLQGAAGDLDPYTAVQTSFVPVRDQGEVLGREAERVTDDLGAGGGTAVAGPADRGVLQLTRRELTVGRYGDPGTRIRTAVEVLQVGSALALVALPGEPFVDLQLSLKARSPVPATFMVGYTNGYAGYLPTRAASREGGYGASYGHTLHMEASTGEAMVEAALQVLSGAGTAVSGHVSTAVTPAGARLEPAYPNPFNAATQLTFHLGAPAPRLRLEVRDLRGARVRTLIDGPRDAGWQRIRWDGRDDRGRPLATGVYWVRLRGVGIAPAVRKLLLLR